MTEEEYKKELLDLEVKYKSDVLNVARKFVTENNPYKKGDIIRDHSCTIIIDKISFSYTYGLPTAVFKGIKLNKDLTPNKRGDIETIFQSNILQKL